MIIPSLINIRRIAEPDLVSAVYSPGTKPYFDNDDTSRKTPDKASVIEKFTTMTEADIDRFVEHYRQAALKAMEVGFDGVELHGANGYVSLFRTLAGLHPQLTVTIAHRSVCK